MKKFNPALFTTFLVLCTYIGLTNPLAAQETQLGFNVGFSTYNGDITRDLGPVSLGNFHPATGLYFKQKHNAFFSTRFGLQYGYISGSDADTQNEPRRIRNLSFESVILELGLMEEFNLIGLDYYEGKYFSPYIFAGIAGYYFNPKTEYLGRLYELQPLGTEGQGIPGYPEKYNLYQFAIPFGLGLKYALTESITLYVEAGGRKLFTDYLDDVSGTAVNYQILQENNGDLAAILANRTGEYLGTEPREVPTGTIRGNPEFDDWYFFTLAGVSWTIYKRDYNPYYRPRRKIFGCPWGR